MNRRELLAASAGVGALGATSFALPADQKCPRDSGQEYYELRQYSVRMGSQAKLTMDYFRDALVPALNRMRVTPVGVFYTDVGGLGPSFYVLMPAKDLETLATVEAHLGRDAQYLEAGAPFLAAPAVQPAFERMDSSLMVALEGWPRLKVPSAAAEHKKRVFELRTYESPSDRDYRRKVEMFNSGEYPAFEKAGFWPIFFGDVLAGARRPCLTYLLGFADIGQRDAMWQAFEDTPEWKKLTSDQRYVFEDILSKVANYILIPMDYSQI